MVTKLRDGDDERPEGLILAKIHMVTKQHRPF